MKKPWDTWVLRGLTINEAAPLFEKMERIQMEPWGHAFGWKHLTLADGRKVKLTIQKNGPVFIYIASVEGEESSEYQYYMDSGFIKLDTLFGNIWQNTITRSLYTNYTNQSLNPFGPKIGVDNGNIPPSFAADEGIETSYADKVDGIKLQAPGSYSGKLRWLIAGQYGLRIDSTEWLERDDFTRTNPAAPRRTGEGILTDDNGAYWYLYLEATGTHAANLTGMATLLEAPFPAYPVQDGVVLTTEQRQRETHILAIAKKTATEWPIVVTGDNLYDVLTSTTYSFGYGWKFNESGREAAILIHNKIGTTGGLLGTWYAYEMNTYAYLATITKDEANEQFIFNITETSVTNWHMPFYFTVWTPQVFAPDIERQLPFYANNQLLFNDFSAPIHCYYDSSDALKVSLFNYTHTTIADNIDPECGRLINGFKIEAYDYQPGGPRHTYTIIHGDETEHTVYNGPIVNGYWPTTYSASTTEIVNVLVYPAHVPLNLSYGTYSGPCLDSGVNIWNWASSGRGVGCQITKTTAYTDVSQFSISTTLKTNAGTYGAMAVVWPFDDADSIVVFTQDNTGYAGRSLHYSSCNYIPSGVSPGGYNWKRVITLDVVQVPGYPIPCPDIGTYHVNPSSDAVVWVNWPGNGCEEFGESEEHYVIATKRILLCPDQTATYTSEEDTDFILNEGDWAGRFFWVPDDPPSSTMTPIYVSRALSGAIRWNDGIETHLQNDYPPDATLVIGWA